MTASPKFHRFSRLTVALLACSLLGACSELDQFLRPDAKPETDQPKATRTAKTLLRQLVREFLLRPSPWTAEALDTHILSRLNHVSLEGPDDEPTADK